MGFVFGKQERLYGITGAGDLIPRRSFSTSAPATVTNDSAMRNSVVWAALRIRADLVSTIPVEIYRNTTIDGYKVQLDSPLTPFFASPDFMEWRYSSQIELDRSGNSIGIITQKNSLGLPAEVELYASSDCSLFSRDGIVKYRINGIEYSTDQIWHEKQYTLSGVPVGLSPVAYAAFTLGQYQSIQQFVTQWFTNGATPRARLKNTAKKLNNREALIVKEAWRASRMADEPFVHGNDWEYSLMQAEQSAVNFIANVNLSMVDASRFFGVPADLLDAAMSGQSITYANITQRNLQFLIMNLGPAIARRENALSQMLPRPRFVKLNEKALLRMDPATRANMIKTQIDSRVLAPSEARSDDDRPPFTPEQIAEFDQLFSKRAGTTGAPANDGTIPDGS